MNEKRSLWRRIAQVFKPEIIMDPYLGEVSIQYNKHSQVCYLEKELVVTGGDAVSFTIVSKSTSISREQYLLVEKISANFARLKRTAYEYLIAMSIEDVDKDDAYWHGMYHVESVSISWDQRPDFWELSFLNQRDGFSYCIVTFHGDDPVEYCFDA